MDLYLFTRKALRRQTEKKNKDRQNDVQALNYNLVIDYSKRTFHFYANMRDLIIVKRTDYEGFKTGFIFPKRTCCSLSTPITDRKLREEKGFNIREIDTTII